jgi:hypothetical protein
MNYPKQKFEVHIIDVKKFSRTPCCGTVLQLLVLVNDIDALVELNRYRRKPTNEPPNFFTNSWSKATLSYLHRLNNSVVFECLDNTISKIYARVQHAHQREIPSRKIKRPLLLWSLIRQNDSLFQTLQQLENFRTSLAYQAMDAVRDKLTAHADEGALKAGLRGTAISDENYGIVAIANTGQFRAFFVDEAAVQQNMDYVSAQGITHEEFRDLFDNIRTLLAKFSTDLLKAFCEENLLFSDSRTERQVTEIIDDTSDFYFTPTEKRTEELWYFADS